jgi:hypothetical protein
VIWDPVPLFFTNPADQAAIRSLQAGSFPLWDPARGLGSPHIIPAAGSFDFPLKALAYIVNSRAGWECYVLAKFFLMGFLTFIAARKLRLGFHGSLGAGLLYMLCGYFRVYYGMPDMETLLFLPPCLMLMAALATRPRAASIAAVVLLGHFLDFSPEALAYGAVYYLLFILWIGLADARAKLLSLPKLLILFGSPAVMAVLTNADATWLVFELIPRSWHFHSSSLGQLHVNADKAIALVTPFFDYWLPSVPAGLDPRNLSQLNLIPAYAGIITTGLAVTALLKPSRLSSTGLFFAAMAVSLAGILFGAPPFNLLARLPVFRYFQNFRYLQPYLAFSMAMLAGIGLEAVARDAASRRLAILTAAALALWIGGHFFVFRRQIIHTPFVLRGLGLAAAGAVPVIIFFAALWWKSRVDKKKVLAWTLLAASGLELALYFNLATPVFGPGAFDTAEPGAARFIKERGGELSRIYGTDQRIIHPNLAGTFGLSDLRDQTPLYARDYVEFMAAVNGLSGEEVAESFLEYGKFYFDLKWDRLSPQLLSLLNVRYVLSYSEPGAKPAFAISRDVIETVAPAANYIAPASVTAGGVTRQGFFMHAPSRARVKAGGAGEGELVFAAGIADNAGQCAATDGVELTTLVYEDARPRLAFARIVRAGRDDSWVAARTGISGNAELVFASLPGPLNDPRCDFGAFTMPERMPPPSPQNASRGLQLVYDRELRVYENREVLPRVFSVGRTVPATLSDFVKEVRERDPSERAWIMGPVALPLTAPLSRARISGIEEGYGRLSFRAQAAGKAFVVISNLYYPGWRAMVNGRETRIYKVNGLMQGIELPEGESEVRLFYEAAPFRFGIYFHITSLVCALSFLAAGLASRAKPRESRPGPSSVGPSPH